MHIFKEIAEARAFSNQKRVEGNSIGFVPTMGALHEGHLSLVRSSIESCAVTVVSIFVNPIQFNQNSDLESYPRDFDKDIAMLEKLGVDAIFAPDEATMYPGGDCSYVEVINEMSGRLEGMSRPGHFRGVTTVVAKLFNIVQPDSAFFGLKDAQQALIISRMVDDLNFPIKIELIETMREADGLAMSSRNARLSPEERKQASLLKELLDFAREKIEGGERNAMGIIAGMHEMLKAVEVAEIDYISIVTLPNCEDADILESGRIMVALAIYFGDVRLIDNCILEVD